MKRNQPTHWAVAGTKEDHGHLVPYCPNGYRAWKRAGHVIQNTLPSQVDCQECRKALFRIN